MHVTISDIYAGKEIFLVDQNFSGFLLFFSKELELYQKIESASLIRGKSCHQFHKSKHLYGIINDSSSMSVNANEDEQVL